MKEKAKQEETAMPFSTLIRPLDPAKGITIRDYFDALDGASRSRCKRLTTRFAS